MVGFALHLVHVHSLLPLIFVAARLSYLRGLCKLRFFARQRFKENYPANKRKTDNLVSFPAVNRWVCVTDICEHFLASSITKFLRSHFCVVYP